jgi:hypothetical protein
LSKLPKSGTWKGKRVFGVPLRIYQQTTGHVLPRAISNGLHYVRMHAGKCDGLFRKPGVKSKIDRLRAQIESIDTIDNQTATLPTIKFDDYQPFVVADVIRQYFRELPECLISPLLTRLLCDLIKCKKNIRVSCSNNNNIMFRCQSRRTIACHAIHILALARRES